MLAAVTKHFWMSLCRRANMTIITWNLCVRSRWCYWKIRKLSLESSFVHRVWKSRIDNRRRRLQLRILRQKYHADRQHQAGYGDRGNIIHPLTQFTKVMQDRSNEHTFTRTLASETVSLKKEAATAACIKLAGRLRYETQISVTMTKTKYVQKRMAHAWMSVLCRRY